MAKHAGPGVKPSGFEPRHRQCPTQLSASSSFFPRGCRWEPDWAAARAAPRGPTCSAVVLDSQGESEMRGRWHGGGDGCNGKWGVTGAPTRSGQNPAPHLQPQVCPPPLSTHAGSAPDNGEPLSVRAGVNPGSPTGRVGALGKSLPPQLRFPRLENGG